MPLVTLIGEELAKEGEEFIYLGPNNECRGCKLKTVCFNLKPGRRYKIGSIREKHHECNVHEGTAVVVEVHEMPIITAIDKKFVEGATSKIESRECQNIGCPNYDLCNIVLTKDKNYIIAKIFDDIDCPIGNKLQKAELSEE